MALTHPFCNPPWYSTRSSGPPSRRVSFIKVGAQQVHHRGAVQLADVEEPGQEPQRLKPHFS